MDEGFLPRTVRRDAGYVEPCGSDGVDGLEEVRHSERDVVETGSVQVHMEGGNLAVAVAEDGAVTLRGPVEEICDGEVSEALLATLSE